MPRPATPTDAIDSAVTAGTPASSWGYVVALMAIVAFGAIGGPVVFELSLDQREDRIVSSVETKYAVHVSDNPRAVKLHRPGTWVIDGQQYTCMLPYEPHPSLACKKRGDWVDYARLSGASPSPTATEPAGASPDPATDPSQAGHGTVGAAGDDDRGEDVAPVLPWEAYTLGG